ncbi:SusC/RagA family TonB-linked outer membrane protein [Echinicola vietnamensis]|uniref:TonB-linked outer membrane protein, SusC/RagA family n=1 Tax=Echinicola vietnamensis (strain DSM 17526 / LMG 23754 / KMM 6221) TaxID=926556 RepID=L0G414_ECHVK|nr:TonB-dependent receptor [Echinicola vietnamensis]AGA79756.1 TonB-linked outer membrane protein, SusC/RagA family [Echinicola vietnamensis DSM 17526]
MKHFTKKAGLLLSLTLGGSMLSSMTALAIPTEKSSTKLHAEMTSLSDMRDITVTGTVISGEDGLTLPGVSILIKGTTRGVTTDMDGKFSIDIPDEGATLVFSFIGFAQQEVEVYTAKDLSITLEPEMTSMTEVVVVGYGTMRKGDVTSSIGGVKEEDFVKGAVRDAAQLVQGKVAGLRVTTPSGDPGASTQINLRGINSINGTSNPLILIDGVPGDLNTVPPEDIESVDVLKDGSAAAIYGTRATGGVILITTKKNSGGNRNSINYNTYVSLQTIARKPELLTGDDYRRLIDEEGIAYTDYGGNTDWVDEMTRNPISQNHNLSFSGGDRKTNFTASLNYRNWQGIFLRSNQERFNIRADLNHSMFDDKLRANFQIINRVFTREEGGADGYAYRQAIIRNPTDQVRTEDGGWQERDGYFYENPISRIYEADSESKFKEMRVNGSLNYNPIDNLDIKLMVSNVQNSNLTGYATSFQHTNTRLNNQNGTASRSTSAYNENLLEFTTNYNKAVGDHYFTLLGGYSWQDATYEDFNASNWDFPTDLYKWNNLGAGGALQAGQAGMGSSKNKWQLAGFFGRATYSYHEKYLFMASVRREGSSRFGENSQWGTFPAVSVGWRISNEPFLKNSKNIGEIKLRAGFGVTGTIANSPYLSQISYDFTRAQGAYIGGQWVQGFIPARNFNPDLRWERKEEYNFGVDYSFFNDRLSGSIDVYRRDIKDLLYNFPVPVPPYLTNSMTINAGVLQNDGIEVLVNVVPIQKKDFSWNTSITYSTNRNKLVSLSNDQFEATNDFFTAGYTGEPIQDYTHRVEVGGAIGRFYVWKTVGTTEDGEWLIENQAGENIPISEASQEDRQYYGNGIPLHILGFNNSLRFKNFDMQANFRGAFGHEILNFQRMFYENPYNPAYNMLKTAYDPVYGNRLNSDLALVSHYIEDGDYFKLDNLTIGYTIPKLGFLRNARVYASGLNLFTITKYKGIDPEGVSITGFDPGNDQRDKYPTTRTYTLGLNVTF